MLSLWTKSRFSLLSSKKMKPAFMICFVILNYQIGFSQQSPTENHRIRFGVTGGVGITDMKFALKSSVSFSNANRLPEANFSSSVNPVLGIFSQFHVNEKRAGHIIGVETMYHRYNYQSDSISIFSEKGVYRFSLGYLRNTLNYRYAYPMGKIDISVLAGFTFGFNLKLENSYDYKTGNATGSDPLGVRKPANDIGFLGGFGMQYKRLGVDIRYYRSNPFTNNTNLDFSAKASTIFLMAHYALVNR
jgi:hypothetical protein